MRLFSAPQVYDSVPSTNVATTSFPSRDSESFVVMVAMFTTIAVSSTDWALNSAARMRACMGRLEQTSTGPAITNRRVADIGLVFWVTKAW
jgi:hypothetical protein